MSASLRLELTKTIRTSRQRRRERILIEAIFPAKHIILCWPTNRLINVTFDFIIIYQILAKIFQPIWAKNPKNRRLHVSTRIRPTSRCENIFAFFSLGFYIVTIFHFYFSTLSNSNKLIISLFHTYFTFVKVHLSNLASVETHTKYSILNFFYFFCPLPHMRENNDIHVHT